MILTHYDKHYEPAIDLAKKLIKVIVQDGHHWSKSSDFLLIKWPRERHEDKFYLGGAHGLMGVLQMLLQAVNVIPQLQGDKVLTRVLQLSIDFVLD